MSHEELSTAFLVGDKLWSIDRVTPYGATCHQGYTLFDSDIIGTTVEYSTHPTMEKELV